MNDGKKQAQHKVQSKYTFGLSCSLFSCTKTKLKLLVTQKAPEGFYPDQIICCYYVA